MASARDIVTLTDFDPAGIEWVDPDPEPGPIEVLEYDPAWPVGFATVAGRIRAVLGDRVLGLEHIGSTSVPGLPAKPIIDVDLTVADNNDEPAYAPDLSAAGFVHRNRERAWYGHRMFIGTGPRAFVHVWSPDSPEAIRHRMLRDWLIAHDDDRELYVSAKRAAAAALRGGDERPDAEGRAPMMRYNHLKEPVLREILARMFHERGLTD